MVGAKLLLRNDGYRSRTDDVTARTSPIGWAGPGWGAARWGRPRLPKVVLKDGPPKLERFGAETTNFRVRIAGDLEMVGPLESRILLEKLFLFYGSFIENEMP
ncbi:hypothetical protein GWI33_004540 [Rhynchophorus ferrugineus]|uniref:Uncharacterized protein n=1 Tax=Rhynchophorus ferrugineus TaxID=354439 RepID=A0A834IM53_RHYFE|nr:hypothetical protein GWI33_004540 [Rhynchophorus ferrugineus]